MGRCRLSPAQPVLSEEQRSGLETPLGEDQALAGPATSPALPEEPVHKGVLRLKFNTLIK